MHRWRLQLLSTLAVLGLVAACERPTQQPTGPGPTFSVTTATQQDTALFNRVTAINRQLAEQGFGMAIEAIDFFTIGIGRPSIRMHQIPFRWVPNDPRRLAEGDHITYLVDRSEGATLGGLTNAQTEAAIDAALATWANDKALKKVTIVKRSDTGADPDIFDFFFGFGGFGNPFVADIVEAGWLPRAFFEVVGGPGAGRQILAFSVTFIFGDVVNGVFVPSDIDWDNYGDISHSEVYYNSTFGDLGDDRAGNPWGIDVALPGIDVESVALHETGHSLGLGHFGPPPDAVMNDAYVGIRQSPLPADDAGMNAVWSSWPNRSSTQPSARFGQAP